MKLKKDLLLREVAGTWIVVPVNEMSVSFNGMLTLNESGVLLWRRLESGADREKLLDAMQEEYEVERETAAADVDAFLGKLRSAGVLEENA